MYAHTHTHTRTHTQSEKKGDNSSYLAGVEEELSAPPGQDREEYVKIKDKTEATFLYFHIFSECPQQVQNCSILWAGQRNAGFGWELV